MAILRDSTKKKSVVTLLIGTFVDDADLIEAIAEGVTLSSLDKITDGHIARLLVLRPRLTKAERIANLRTVFLLLGDGYDFKFYFDNSSYQCCTEVIYRVLNTVGPVNFSLTPRAGTQTLSADDIINYSLTAKKTSQSMTFIPIHVIRH